MMHGTNMKNVALICNIVVHLCLCIDLTVAMFYLCQQLQPCNDNATLKLCLFRFYVNI